ncbi:MAG: transglycosylase SLT domain-containing protein [Deltaproteobacteria bacterium]|nr:transglycosylase SLT domain-containing protein [Deltaproteobacteria bacterium]
MKIRSLFWILSVLIFLPYPTALRAQNSALKAGYEAFLQGDSVNAVKLLSGPATSKGPLQDYALWGLGKSQIETGDLEGGTKTLDFLIKAEPDSLFADAAKVQLGRALQAGGENQKAKEALEKLLPQIEGNNKGEALYYLGLAKIALKDVDGGITDLKSVYLQYPTASVADLAKSQIIQARGQSALTWSLPEYLPRADAFFQAKSYAKALEVYQQISGGLEGAMRELARVKQGETLYNLKRYGDAAIFLEPGPSVPTEAARGALLHLGMSQLRNGDEGAAVATFERVQRQYPGTPEGEEALYRAGMIAHQAGRFSEASEVFGRLAQAYPQGNFRDKALWAAAWAAYRRGDWEQSSKWLTSMEQGATDGPTRGKALYWQARVQEKQGKKDSVPQTLQRGADSSPYSYYGFLALKRLKNSDALPQTPEVPASWKTAPPAPHGAGGEKIERPLARWDTHFRKAEALAELGLGKLAPTEIDAALKQNQGQAEGMAHLLEAAKKTRAYFIPVLLGQKYWDRFKSLFADPVAAESYRTRLQYPYAYREEIEKAGAQSSVPPQLVVALMRQESGFMPWISSGANAQGLMQLLPATASGRARALGISPGDLFDPNYNIQVGAAELKAMLSRFSDNWAYAFAAYNAGPGRAKQWSEQFGNLATDEFIEEIPFAETNLYVKLVMRNYWSYKTLYP